MAKKNGTRTRAEAKKLMWEYYRDNKASLPKCIGEFREEILERLLSGDGVVEAFGAFCQTVESDTEVTTSVIQTARNCKAA